MSLNNDFSFVRFLKVVKTLYESSVFTRIGKTVGEELDKQMSAGDEDTLGSVASLETMPENADGKDDAGILCTIAKLITCEPDDYSVDDNFNEDASFDSRH